MNEWNSCMSHPNNDKIVLIRLDTGEYVVGRCHKGEWQRPDSHGNYYILFGASKWIDIPDESNFKNK
ncbi:MAG: hypothetical protein AABY32_01035 [Nanoarchaeota archaeon]